MKQAHKSTILLIFIFIIIIIIITIIIIFFIVDFFLGHPAESVLLQKGGQIKWIQRILCMIVVFHV